MTLAELARFLPPVKNNGLMHWWQGASGCWYIHTVYPIHAVPDFKACNYIFARPHFDGTRQPFYIGQSGDFDRRLDRHEKLGAAIRLGATEVHVHFLARSRQERLDIETDLRRAHTTPLNEQPRPAPPFLPFLLSPSPSPSPSPPSSSQPVLADLKSLANALGGTHPKPDPSVPLGALAGLNLKPVPSDPLFSLANLVSSAPRVRSRSSWNDRLTHWERPASDSEEQQINRAANMVRTVLSKNARLNDEGLIIHPQGSYHNNTNVRLEADMDLRAVHPLILVEYAPGIDVGFARNTLGLYDTGRTFSGVAKEIRREITGEFNKKFGRPNVDASGSKAIRLKKQPGSRADVDIALTFRYFWVMWDSFASTWHVEEGVAILGKDGNWTRNFPNQHYTNGIAKRVRTKHRFKKNVRIFKRLRNELENTGQLTPKQVPSFLIECLTYAVEDEYFLVETDDRYDRALRLLARMDELLHDADWVRNATEINEIKYLFHSAQPWTVNDAKAFVRAARLRMKA